jgi:transcriptional regulator with XRE-family HTH domain
MEPGPFARLRALGLTQVELAERLVVGQSTISQWETGARRMPGLVMLDLWELLRVVEEKIRAGMDVHKAIEGWHPTVLLNPGGSPTLTSGFPQPMSEAHQAALERGDLEEAERLELWDTIDLLKAEQGHPLTAERKMRIRRLSIAVKLAVESMLRFEEGQSHADHREA